jgi:preprotein translocase subunit SecY
MASAAEQMAANLSWGMLGKASDLRQRIFFTIGLLIVYRLGTYIPVPGIDGQALREFMQQAGQGIGGMLNLFTGGAVSRMAIFALGIMPYISASIIVQLLGTMYGPWQQLKKEGEQGRKKLNQYTRYGTVALAILQGYGIAMSIQGGGLAHNPGYFFVASCVITLVGGTMFRNSGSHRPVLRPRSVRCAVDPGHPGGDRHGGRRHRFRRFHGTRAAEDLDPLPAPSGGHEGL